MYAMQIANYNINVTFICKRLYLHLVELHHVRCKRAELPDLRQRIRLEFQPLFQVDLQREREEKKKQTNRIITTMIIYLYTKFIEFLHLYVYIILYESTHKTQTLKIA